MGEGKEEKRRGGRKEREGETYYSKESSQKVSALSFGSGELIKHIQRHSARGRCRHHQIFPRMLQQRELYVGLFRGHLLRGLWKIPEVCQHFVSLRPNLDKEEERFGLEASD